MSASQVPTITLQNGGGNASPAGATILFVVTSSGKKNLDRFETLTAAAGAQAVLQPALTSGTVRIVIEVAAPNGGGQVLLGVTQPNGVNYQDEITADTEFTYDVQ